MRRGRPRQNKQTFRLRGLRRMREAAGLSTQTIADRVGADRSTYYRWERGSPVTLATIAKLSAVLGETLLVRSNTPKHPRRA